MLRRLDWYSAHRTYVGVGAEQDVLQLRLLLVDLLHRLAPAGRIVGGGLAQCSPADILLLAGGLCLRGLSHMGRAP